MALAHAIKNKTEAAYRRGALQLKRGEMMNAWATQILVPSPQAQTVPSPAPSS